ncbi:hypothetical protein BGX27_010210 [Mortierella sp. AM989]|nr:hypothetical protein BGX27_010210 [Mortierella sp. AM989]
MDNFSMAFMSEFGLFEDCEQSAFPSTEPHLTVNNSAANTFEHIIGSSSFDFPDTNVADITWDSAPSKLQLQQLFNPVPGSMMDFTPELSPATSLATPAPNSLRSPVPFDNLLDELGSSPSVGWQSPLDHTFGSQQSQESFEFGFGLDAPQNSVWPTQNDFQLFPDNSASVTSLEQLLMTPAPVESELSVFEESPFESDLDYFSPHDSCAASPAMSEYTDLFGDSNETSRSISRCGSGFQPLKRRRRRVTTEEDARVIPDESKDDPNARARYKCSECDKTFSRPFNLRSHRATHAGEKPFNCGHVSEKGEVCLWSFARRHDLERHMRSRHSGQKLFKCKTCGAECGRNDAFKRHLQRHAACGLAALKEQESNQTGA